MRSLLSPLLVVSMTTLCFGCAGSHRGIPQRSGSSAVLALDLAETRPAGETPAFRPAAINDRRVALAGQVGALSCREHRGIGYGAHIELFAHNRGIVVPAGIGIARPLRRDAASVIGGRCVYPLRTIDPTGVVEVARGAGRPPTVGELFSLWGQPLSSRRLAGFAGPVIAFLDGRRWPGDPRRIPLGRHAQVVLEVGPLVRPHPAYLFPPWL